MVIYRTDFSGKEIMHQSVLVFLCTPKIRINPIYLKQIDPIPDKALQLAIQMIPSPRNSIEMVVY